MSLVTARAILLRAHPYSESSRILRFLTDGGGMVSVMARGVRKSRSGAAAGLDTFAQGDLIYYMKETRDLQTYKEFAVTHPRRGLGRDPARLAGASVLAELVLRHAEQGETRSLFQIVAASLDRLAETETERLPSALLCEGWSLIAALGFQPDLKSCIVCGRPVDDDAICRLDLAQGGLRCGVCAAEGGDGSGVGPRVGPGARAQLRTMIDGRVPDDLRHARAHLQLLSDFATYHLAGARPLDAFRVFAALMPADSAGHA